MDNKLLEPLDGDQGWTRRVDMGTGLGWVYQDGRRASR